MKRKFGYFSLSIAAAIFAGIPTVMLSDQDYKSLSAAEETATIPCVIYYEYED